ncbi:MAG: hypothetical protein ACRDH7_15400 [Actinomycetota bacterium]
MDDYKQGWLIEIGGSVVVGLGSLVLGLAFRAAPLLTVLGTILLVLLVGASLFVLLFRRQDSGLSRRWLAVHVVVIMAISMGAALVIWVAYFSNLFA